MNRSALSLNGLGYNYGRGGSRNRLLLLSGACHCLMGACYNNCCLLISSCGCGWVVYERLLNRRRYLNPRLW